MEVSFVIAKTTEQFADGRKLFEEYAASLNFNLCFQGFTEELNQLDQQYNSPTGALIIAYVNNNAAAVVGIRQFEPQKAELKRMYTKPEYRGQKIGNNLLQKAINIATELGYKQLLLDTLPEMKAAIKLYEVSGFLIIEPYRYNPFDTAIYMAKDLIPLNKI
jgi:ribosomal protein S18 acetylase RimI-like enzyme